MVSLCSRVNFRIDALIVVRVMNVSKLDHLYAVNKFRYSSGPALKLLEQWAAPIDRLQKFSILYVGIAAVYQHWGAALWLAKFGHSEKAYEQKNENK